MTVQTKTLWQLVWGMPHIDPGDLAAAVAAQAESGGPLDPRTQMLIRDSVKALNDYWGPAQLDRRLQQFPARPLIERICREAPDEGGFSTIKERLMDKTDPEYIRRLFRDIGAKIDKPLRLMVGGSAALIVPGYVTRATDDIDVVDEIPEPLRSQHAFLAELQNRYGLLLTHFQSHYLPSGWQDRAHYLDTYGSVQVYLVDVMDVFLSKLFSIRKKDLNDIHVLASQLDKESLTDRLKRTTVSMLASESLRQRAEHNWYILFGEKLPYDPDTPTSQGTT